MLFSSPGLGPQANAFDSSCVRRGHLFERDVDHEHGATANRVCRVAARVNSGIPFRAEHRIPAFALISFALFVFVAFGWRSLCQYWQTGDAGIRIVSGDTTARVESSLLLVGLLLARLAPAIELLGGSPPLRAIAPHAAHVVGVAAFGSGFALTVISQAQMSASWRIGVRPSERTNLVTNGISRYARNPVFTGICLALAGLVLLVPNGLSALAAMCTLAGLQVQVRLVE